MPNKEFILKTEVFKLKGDDWYFVFYKWDLKGNVFYERQEHLAGVMIRTEYSKDVHSSEWGTFKSLNLNLRP